MSNPRKEDALEVIEDPLDGLAVLGCAGGQRLTDLAGLDLGEDRAVVVPTGEVIGNPVHELVRRSPERLGVHVAELGRGNVLHAFSLGVS